MNLLDLELTKTNDFCKNKEPKLTVVLIHGIASDSHSFDKAIDYFKNDNNLDDIRFVSFDLLGSGKSLKSDELDYNYQEQLSAMHRAIKNLNVKTAATKRYSYLLGSLLILQKENNYLL